jgi:hypothetical protein
LRRRNGETSLPDRSANFSVDSELLIYEGQAPLLNLKAQMSEFPLTIGLLSPRFFKMTLLMLPKFY